MLNTPKLIRITTVPLSLDKLLEGQLGYMSHFYNVTAISASDDGYLERVAKREGVPFHPIELTRSITPFKDLKSLNSLVKYFRKVKPTIVHTHTPKAGTAGMLAAKLAGVPIRLHTVAGLPLLEATNAKRTMLNMVEKITYSAATKILPNSHGLKQIILNEGFTSENKLHVIGSGSSNGIDTDYFDPDLYSEEDNIDLKRQLDIQPDDFVYIFVGRLVKDKGIEELIDAFGQLSMKNIKLLLIGPKENSLNPLDPIILSKIKKHRNILDLGWQNDVRPYMAISDVLTFPSYREGFPNVVLQAGAMKLPAIVSNINGCNEIIDEMQNGLIIPVKDAASLSKAMEKLYLDRDLYHKLKSRTRDKIINNYKRETIMEALRLYYDLQVNNLHQTKKLS